MCVDQFYVATGVLSLLYCIFIIAVYAFLDEVYKSKSEIPLADFMLTTILAIFWLSGSAAWSNGTNALKSATDASFLHGSCELCNVSTSSFSRLNISLVSQNKFSGPKFMLSVIIIWKENARSDVIPQFHSWKYSLISILLKR